MFKITIYTFLIFSISACSSSYYLKKNEFSYNELNEEIEDREVTVKLLNGEEFSADNVKIMNDSLLWLSEESDSGNSKMVDINKTPISEINKINYNNYSKGITEWMGIGAGFGMIVGTSIGMIVTPDEYNSIGATVGFLIGAGSGLIVGLPVGAVVGHEEKYIINEPTEKYFTIEILEILDETDDFIHFIGKDKRILLPKSEIKERFLMDDKEFLRIYESAYITYFK